MEKISTSIQLGQILRHNFLGGHYLEYKVLKIQDVAITMGMHHYSLDFKKRLCPPICLHSPTDYDDTFIYLEIVASCMPDHHLQRPVGYQFRVPQIITTIWLDNQLTNS